MFFLLVAVISYIGHVGSVVAEGRFLVEGRLLAGGRLLVEGSILGINYIAIITKYRLELLNYVRDGGNITY